MEKKYPVLKCDKQLWKEIKPVLESFGVTNFEYVHEEYITDDYEFILISNYKTPCFDELIIGSIPYTGDIIDIELRYKVDTKEEFLSAVAKLLGKEYFIKSDFKNLKYSKESDEKENISQEVIISKNGNDFDKDKNNIEKINIANKLRHCNRGIKLYSPIYGEVEFIKTEDSVIYVKVVDVTNTAFSKVFNENGMYDDYPNGECLLFPSKDNRDWNTFQVLEKGHRVMCSDNGLHWSLRKYYKDDEVIRFDKENIDDTSIWKYIVAVEDFDFTAKDITINKEKSIV